MKNRIIVLVVLVLALGLALSASGCGVAHYTTRQGDELWYGRLGPFEAEGVYVSTDPNGIHGEIASTKSDTAKTLQDFLALAQQVYSAGQAAGPAK